MIGKSREPGIVFFSIPNIAATIMNEWDSRLLPHKHSSVHPVAHSHTLFEYIIVSTHLLIRSLRALAPVRVPAPHCASPRVRAIKNATKVCLEADLTNEWKLFIHNHGLLSSKAAAAII